MKDQGLGIGMRSVAAIVILLGASISAQQALPFIPVGVVVGPVGGAAGSREDLLAFVKLRFNVIARREPSTRELRLESLARVLSQTPGGMGSPIPSSGVEPVAVHGSSSAEDVRSRAWRAIARGARGVVFDGAPALMQNSEALQAASAFADNITRNAALFAPLKPRPSKGDVRVDAGSSEIDAGFLESPVALVLIAVNLRSSGQRVTLTFSPAIPEAIWQNMESGGAVNFVAGPDGPTYTRTFTPHDVVVLMIRKQYR